MSDMQAIEAACKAARDARQVLSIRAQALQDEITAAQRRKLPGIRGAIASVAETDARLFALLQAAPDLFKSPKSAVMHGMRVGYKKGSGKIEITNVEATLKLIRKHFPDQFDVLVKTEEKPIKKALQALSAADLKRLGIQVEATGDVVFIADATDSVDKLVAALLKGVEAEQQDDNAEVLP